MHHTVAHHQQPCAHHNTSTTCTSKQLAAAHLCHTEGLQVSHDHSQRHAPLHAVRCAAIGRGPRPAPGRRRRGRMRARAARHVAECVAVVMVVIKAARRHGRLEVVCARRRAGRAQRLFRLRRAVLRNKRGEGTEMSPGCSACCHSAPSTLPLRHEATGHQATGANSSPQTDRAGPGGVADSFMSHMAEEQSCDVSGPHIYRLRHSGSDGSRWAAYSCACTMLVSAGHRRARKTVRWAQKAPPPVAARSAPACAP